MKITFSANDLTQTTLLGSENEPIYTVGSERKALHRPNLTILRCIPGDTRPHLVGEIEYRFLDRDSVKVHGQELERNVATFTNTMNFRASDGRLYKWRHTPNGVKLITGDWDAGYEIARFHKETPGLKCPADPALLIVDDRADVYAILDDIVTTCCYMEVERRRRKRGAA